MLSHCSVFLVCPTLNEPSKLKGEIKVKDGFLLGIDVDAEVEGLVGAVAPENDLRPLLAVRWDFPDHHHLLTVVVAEPDSLELHHHRQGGIVHRELRGKGDVVLLVRGVDQADVLGREGNLLARGGGTGVQLAGNPSLVPSTHSYQLLIERPLRLTIRIARSKVNYKEKPEEVPIRSARVEDLCLIDELPVPLPSACAWLLWWFCAVHR